MPRLAPILIAAGGVALAVQFVAVAALPLLSDDWSHLATVSAFASWRDAFDPGLVPLRPLQWWVFHAFVDADRPVLSRLPAITLLAASALLVFGLARRLGAGAPGAALTVLLFAAFGHVTQLGWPAAIGWPGRTFGLLLGLSSYVAWLDRRSPAAALGVVGGQLVALGFHQSAVILPAWCALAALSLEGRAAIGRRLRDPLTWTLVAIVVPYLVYMTLLRPERGHAGTPAAALPASLFRASTFWLPEPLRHLAVDAARDGRLAVALPLAAAGPALAVLAVVRGGAARLLAGAIVVDVVFSAVFAGFRPRYAPTAAALLAIGAARVLEPVRGVRLAIAGALAATYLTCTARDIGDFRRVGRAVAGIEGAVTAADRRAPSGATLVLVDVPGELDRDLDVPLFRYGLLEAVRAFGVTRPVELWSVDSVRGAVPALRRDEAAVHAARSAADRVVVRFDPVDATPHAEAAR